MFRCSLSGETHPRSESLVLRPRFPSTNEQKTRKTTRKNQKWYEYMQGTGFPVGAACPCAAASSLTRCFARSTLVQVRSRYPKWLVPNEICSWPAPLKSFAQILAQLRQERNRRLWVIQSKAVESSNEMIELIAKRLGTAYATFKRINELPKIAADSFERFLFVTALLLVATLILCRGARSHLSLRPRWSSE